ALLEQAKALLEGGAEASLRTLLESPGDAAIAGEDALPEGAEITDDDLAAAIAAALQINTGASVNAGTLQSGSAGGSAGDPPASPTTIPAAADAGAAARAAILDAMSEEVTRQGPSAEKANGNGVSANGVETVLARLAARGDAADASGARNQTAHAPAMDAAASQASADAASRKSDANADQGGRGQSGAQAHGDARQAAQLAVGTAAADGRSALLQLQQVDAGGQPISAQAIAVPAATTIAGLSTAAAPPYGAATAGVPVDMIAVAITRQANAGNSRFQIRLDPPELGRIDVRLDLSSDGRVNTHLKVDNPDTYDAIQRDPRALERALQNAGLKVDDGSIQVSLRDSGGFMQRHGQDHPRFQNFEQSAAAYGGDNWSAEETVVEPWRLAPASGGLDMRV
ncbi:MAG: flagellar hook-length control protein FliK, partial [Flavobacteriaceae bacterium]